MQKYYTKPRSIILFDESIRSRYTKNNYNSHLNQFIRFLGITSPDKLLLIPQNDLQQLLEDYLLELKQSINPNSVPSKFQGIRHFCIMNQINVNWTIIQKMFPQKQKMPQLRSYTSDEIACMLNCIKNLRDKALIHFLASTGARIGIFDHKLTVKHMMNMPDSCIAVKLYAGDVEEYWSFLTPQASKALNAYHMYRRRTGEIFTEDAPVFAIKNRIPKQLGWNGTRSAIYRIVSKSNITRHKQNLRYDVQIDHGFRKRFNTILKLDNSVNYNIAEKLMGHKNGLDGVYLTPTIDEMFKEFRKIIYKLEIPKNTGMNSQNSTSRVQS